MNLSKNPLDVKGYEFSENQKNLWQLGSESRQMLYSQTTLELKQAFSIDRLQEAIQAVIKEHKVLSFKTYHDPKFIFPVQFSSQSTDIDLKVIDSTDDDHKADVDKELSRAYNTAENEPIRFCAVHVSGQLKYIVIRLYALWGDAYSLQYFCNELATALVDVEAYKANPSEKVDYVNFCAWQNELMKEPEVAATHFFDNYALQLPSQVVPFTERNDSIFEPQRSTVSLIKGKEYTALKAYCEKNNILLSDLLMFQFGAYLSGFTSNELTIGLSPFRRNYEDLDNTLGLVNKTIPVKISPENLSDKKQGIGQLRKNVEQIDAWVDYFSLDRENASEQSLPYFNYSFEYIDFSESQTKDYQNFFQPKDAYYVQDQFDLKVSCKDIGDVLVINLYYDQSKIPKNTLSLVESQLKEQFAQLTSEEASAPGLSALEKKIITQANSTQQTFDSYNSIIELFDIQAKAHTDQVALVYEDQQWTYRQVDALSDQLAVYLQHTYKLKNDPVCILLDRSEWFVIAVLAVLKAGAYYIPIDRNYPEDRIKFILEDSNCKVLITNDEAIENLNLSGFETLSPKDEKIKNTQQNLTDRNFKSSDIAYCIYTSGSTGNPKGCLVTHSNLLHYIQWANAYYYEDEKLGDWGLITSVSFDLTITALFSSLTRGKKIWIGNEDKDINVLLEDAFNSPHVNTLKLTPTHVTLLSDLEISQTNVGLIICGGEQLTKQHVSIIKSINKAIKVYNEYGPTEATVGCIVKEVKEDDTKILIGKPIANTNIYILDEERNPANVGAIGEIYIAGGGISKGYLNRPDLMREKFIEDPKEKERRFYKTGDLGRWFPTGEIEYLGRNDNQIKLNGYRIELSEIESKLLEKGGIDQVAALLKETDNGMQIVVYLAGKERQNVIELRNYLGQLLPLYMIPGYFIWLEKIPLTVNGKADINYLKGLEIKTNSTGVEYKAPRNELEEKLVAIWKEILLKDKVGVQDDFFLLGGNSLRAIRLVNFINKEFGLKYDLRGVYTESTIELIAERIAIDNRFKSSVQLSDNKYDEIKI